MSARVVIVVPCFNEAARLPVEAFAAFGAKAPDVGFGRVDDGSTDATQDRLRELERRDPARFSLLATGANRGKAEAVRAGMLRALDVGATYAGYWDADLATPLEEIPRFVDVLERMPERRIVFGARVALLGRDIRRRAWRHYLGRVFATLASETLRVPVYDTQCGAKLFRAAPETRALFAEPFLSEWVFDVELVARLVAALGPEAVTHAIYELPLERWTDVGDSKVRPRDFARAALDLVRIQRRYLRR